MAKIFTLEQIQVALEKIDPLAAIEKGFVAYSKGKAVVPPIGELLFENPPGDVHIKYGYLCDDQYFVIKIASGFYENFKLNLPSSQGLMLVFKQMTGELAGILLDEGHLTNVRTAAAGAVAAKYLGPGTVHRIGILGTGTQGQMQLEYLQRVTHCKEVMVWGRSEERLRAYKSKTERLGLRIQLMRDVDELVSSCNLIVTTTPAKAPLFRADMVQSGTHITAVGSDTPEKNELEPEILQKADIVVADSLSQCLSRGEIHHAINAGVLKQEEIVELGKLIVCKELQRTTEEQITVVDLTGVAVQDIQIAKAVYGALIA